MLTEQFKLLEDFWLMPEYEALDHLIADQLGYVTLGHHLVQQIRAIVLFGVHVLSLGLAHFLFEHDDLLDGGLYIVLFGGFEIGALFGRSGFEQVIGMSYSDGIAGDHQLHPIRLPGHIHIAQIRGQFWRELLVLQSGFASRQMSLIRLMRRLSARRRSRKRATSEEQDF